MSLAASKIFNCQAHMVDLLNADPFFNDPDTAKKIVAISQRKGNIAVAVAQGLQKLGAGVIVMLPLMTWEGEANRVSLGLKFAVVVTENPTINQGANGSGKPAEAIVEKILQLVHWKPNGVSAANHAQAGLFKIDRNAVRIMEPTSGSMALLNYTIAVNTSINL
jgi:hypothetical protein